MNNAPFPNCGICMNYMCATNGCQKAKHATEGTPDYTEIGPLQESMEFERFTDIVAKRVVELLDNKKAEDK